MSTDVNFYVRVNDKFAPIGHYTRSSTLYRAFDGISQYGKIVPLSEQDLYRVASVLNDEYTSYANMKENNLKKIDKIMNAKNTPLKEKMDMIGEYEIDTAELDELIEENTEAKYFVGFLLNLLNDYTLDWQYIDDDEYKSILPNNDYNEFLYIGIDDSRELKDIYNG